MALPVNNSSLLNELRSTLSKINTQIEVIEAGFKKDKEQGIYLPDVTIYQLKNNDGYHILENMLLAKSNCLQGIAALQAPVKR